MSFPCKYVQGISGRVSGGSPLTPISLHQILAKTSLFGNLQVPLQLNIKGQGGFATSVKNVSEIRTLRDAITLERAGRMREDSERKGVSLRVSGMTYSTSMLMSSLAPRSKSTMTSCLSVFVRTPFTARIKSPSSKTSLLQARTSKLIPVYDDFC